MKEIDEIVNGSYKVTDKQKMLDEFSKRVNNKIKQAEIEIAKGYKYCPACGEYYKEKSFDIGTYKEKRNVCTFHSLSEFDDDTYEDKMCVIKFAECPMGHKVEEDVYW